MSGWIGVDLDGTLAYYDGWKGASHIGEPVAPMMARVRGWLAEGKAVKIFTARVAIPEPDRSKAIKHIHEWLESHGLPRLDITNIKTLDMEALWDDRAIQVIQNTGMLNFSGRMLIQLGTMRRFIAKLHVDGIVSEGQAAKATGLGRIGVRALADDITNGVI